MLGVGHLETGTFVAKRVQTNLVARHERSPRLVLQASGMGAPIISQLSAWEARSLRRQGTPRASGGGSSFSSPALGLSSTGSVTRRRFAGAASRDRARQTRLLHRSLGDALSTVFIMTGIGASYYASMTAALFTLAGYLLMSIHVFLKNSATGKMQLTFMYCGPTEIRLAILFFNLVAYCSGINTFNLIGHEF